MSVFENLLGNWVQIIDDQNETTIENYGYDTGIIEGTTANHCSKCVAVNKCWFKNEKSKKPEKFDITGINLLDTIINGILPGLYHFRCHCKEISIEPTDFEEIELIVPNGKIPYYYMIFPNGKLKMNTPIGGWQK